MHYRQISAPPIGTDELNVVAAMDSGLLIERTMFAFAVARVAHAPSPYLPQQILHLRLDECLDTGSLVVLDIGFCRP